MALKEFPIGPITIYLPNENQGYFSLFEDLAELFDTPYQSDAVKLLKTSLTDIRPRPSIDYESDYTHITTTNIKTLIAVVDAITSHYAGNALTSFLSSTIDTHQLEQVFSDAKKNRPKPKKWNTGDFFSIPLIDGAFSFGQVLDKKYCTCALYEVYSDNDDKTLTDLKKLDAVSILHLSNGDLLNNGAWRVLCNAPVTLDPHSGNGGRFGDIGSTSFGQCGIMSDLANAWWGLLPWNVMYDEKYYDGLLLKGILQPDTALVLSSEERITYREQNFKIQTGI